MSQIGLAYTSQGGTSHNFVIDNFGGNDLPRTYQASAEYGSSANGAVLQSGPAFRQKYQWAISTIMSKSDAADFDEMFTDWDADRAAGYPVACGITDETFGAVVNGSVVFGTPPSYTRLGPGLMLVSFGLLEA